MNAFLITFLSTNLAALLFAPVPATLPGSILFVTGLALIIRADYGRKLEPLTVPAATRRRNERLPLAA